MIDIFLTIVSITAPFLAAWAGLGWLAYSLGYAENWQNGMVLVQKKVSEFFADTSPASTSFILPVEQYHLAGLTKRLQAHFECLVLESAWENADWLCVVYRQTGCAVPEDVVELIFKNFLKDFFNLPADSTLHVSVDMDNERLSLSCAYSKLGWQELEKRKLNHLSRKFPSSGDLIE